MTWHTFWSIFWSEEGLTPFNWQQRIIFGAICLGVFLLAVGVMRRLNRTEGHIDIDLSDSDDKDEEKIH